MDEIARIMIYMDVLYGIDNPLFMDLKNDPEYLKKTLLPWMFKYMTTIGKIGRLNAPIEDHLHHFTSDPILVDMIAQHFFQKTPAFFALSYFSLYLDYRYPKGGTGRLVDALVDFIHTHGGEIRTGSTVTAVDPQAHRVTDAKGVTYDYGKLIWAADLRYFYSILDIDALASRRDRKVVSVRRDEVIDKTGGDSILTLYLTVDLAGDVFDKISSPHFFYTPRKVGLGSIGPAPSERTALVEWIGRYLDFTTYEISIPSLRDKSLAPAGKTGLIVSTLFDHSLVRRISDEGWYEEFKGLCEERILSVLDASVYAGLKDRVLDRFVSTPLTLEKRTGNSNGAITGWAFTNPFVPAVSSMKKIAHSLRTPVPDVFQAGQWTFSPSGLPISILTGKLASDQALKELKRHSR
jgi:phytoene dehydrogenase-like protein